MRDGLGRIQNVLTIGGSSDIGTAITLELSRTGPVSIVLAGRPSTRLTDTAILLRGNGATVHLVDYHADMPGRDVVAVIDQATTRLGDLDVVLICVGALADEDLLTQDTAATEASLRANLVGPVLAAQAATACLAAQGHGVVVVMSSVAAIRPRHDLPTYGAAKTGLDTYCRALQARIRGTGASLLVIRPGQVRTRMSAGIPDAPLTVDPVEVARSVARNLHGRRRVVYVPTILRPVATVLRLLPAPLFRRLTATARSRSPETARAA